MTWGWSACNGRADGLQAGCNNVVLGHETGLLTAFPTGGTVGLVGEYVREDAQLVFEQNPEALGRGGMDPGDYVGVGVPRRRAATG